MKTFTIPWDRRIAEIARSLQTETGSVDTMDLAVRLAVEAVTGADDAGISLVERDGRIVQTAAATSDRARAADQLQFALAHGPLIDGIWDTEVVSCPDVAIETRWDEWGPRVARETGVRSILCFRMFTSEERVGALSLYAGEPHAFTAADIDRGVSIAAHAAIAIIVARTDEHKDVALDSRAVIGQATGILMERFGMDPLRAFEILRRISQDSNTKLHQVAAELILTRQIPS